jgi:hypothetical protein
LTVASPRPEDLVNGSIGIVGNKKVRVHTRRKQ